MPTYEFRCTGCDKRWEDARFDAYHKQARHVNGDTGETCGRIVRAWGSINVNTTNLRSARG